MVDGGEPGVDSRDEGKHTGRNDLLFVEKMMWMMWYSITHPLFLSGLKTFLLFPTVALPYFLLKYLLHGFPGLFTVISGHICFLLLVFSVFTLFICRFHAVD